MRVLALVDSRWTDVVRIVRVEGTGGRLLSLVEIVAYQSEQSVDMDELLLLHDTSVTDRVSLDAIPQQSGTDDTRASHGEQLPTVQDEIPANERSLPLELSHVSVRFGWLQKRNSRDTVRQPERAGIGTFPDYGERSPMHDSFTLAPDGPPLVEHTVGEDESVNIAVVEAVAAVSDSVVTEIPPLYEVIDPDVLDRLFTTSQADAFLAIRFHGYLIHIHADKSVTLYQEETKVMSA